jgi:aminoglycoside phosphotransferase (APT) family kinase protein
VLPETDKPEHRSLLSCAEVVLNELMLRTSRDYYISYIEAGQALVVEGSTLSAGAARFADLDVASGVCDRSSMDVVSDAIDRLNGALAVIVAQVDESESTSARSFVERVSAWESDLYSHSLLDGGSIAPAEASPFTRDTFQSYLERKFPDWKHLQITRFLPLTGGFSKRTVLFDTEDDVNGRQAFILRAEQAVSLPRFSDIIEEFHLIKFAVDSGLPTPDALWLEADLSHFGKPFVVMEVAKGNNYGWTMGEKLSASDALVQSIIDALCAMHNAKIRPGDPRIARSHLAEWTPFTSIRENSRYYVTEYMPKLIRQTGIEPTPELVRALKWLKENVPDVPDPPVLVHLDFGLNNLLIDGDRVSAILDWESARLGDPCDDILVMQRELADYLSMEEFLERYRAGTGRTISAYNMAYAIVAAFAMYMIVYLNGRQKLLRDERTPIAMSLLAFKYIANTASQLNDLISAAERLRPD